MILYFADKDWNIKLTANSDLPDGLKVYDDNRTDTLETGISTFTATILYETGMYKDVRDIVKATNYVLVEKDGLVSGYTISRTEHDRLSQTIHIEAEDAGLELINEVALQYPGDEIPQMAQPMTMTQFINMWINGTSFTIGHNDAEYDTTVKNPLATNDADGVKEKMSSDSTITARLKDTADLFGYEIGYSFTINQSRIVSKNVDIYKKRGADKGLRLRYNHEVSNIKITENYDNLCTSLLCYGGTAEGASQPITLDGYSYNDGSDFIIDNQYFAGRNTPHACLQSRKALQKYGTRTRGGLHHLTGLFSCDAQLQQKLLEEAKKELEKRCKPEVQYEIEIPDIEMDIKLGDYITIIDEEGELFVKARVQTIEESQINMTRTITLGDHEIIN